MLQLTKITKSYKTGNFVQKALNGVSLNFRKNEFVSILGPSGSGKTTLLNIIGGLDRYDTGDLLIKNKSTKKFKDKDWDAYRNKSVGFIFQSYNLISHINILDNIEMGMTLSGKRGRTRRKKAIELLKKVGLYEHRHKKPNQLSGGQMQRVAIARALANDPEIILADEPTGALDTKTSKQIMELVKEIAKDKLVIMVTHNPELAVEYSDRVINMQDGKIISDSNEFDGSKEEVGYKLKRTKMNFFTALHLSLNNIRTKKGRTILTSFASSIGIIGIAIILALSNGFSKQVTKFEEQTSDAMPVIIMMQNLNLTDGGNMQDMISLSNGQSPLTESEKKEEFTDKKEVKVIKEKETMTINNITEEYMDYLKKINNDYISSVSVDYNFNLNLIQKVDNKYINLNDLNINYVSMPCINFNNDKEGQIFSNYYDLLEGHFPREKNEIMIEVDTANRVNKDLLKAFGITDENISFTNLIGKTIKLVKNDDYYSEFNGLYIHNELNDNLYNNSNNIELKLVGIMRMKKDKADMAAASSNTNTIYYYKTLSDYILNVEENSKIVKAQKNAKYDVRTGTEYNDSTMGKMMEMALLKQLGGSRIPIAIYLYPKDFNSKDKIVEYLDKYNKNKKESDKIGYVDQAKLITNISDGIMSGITVVLIAFSSISLVVSSIMLGIITYISVLERTKEIGILRSLGARKRDIRRVFSAETFIIGFTSGVLGILIAYILTVPINKLLFSLTKLENVAVLNPMHAIILVSISIILTLIGGAIPSRLAAKKDPVVALRTE
ncbi:MAG: ABC transporter ATP-binding protein/permease [Firmicutes bacterium]|nr:ABC transporter ATP-binding protein/permease [Bacillota bacterium]